MSRQSDRFLPWDARQERLGQPPIVELDDDPSQFWWEHDCSANFTGTPVRVITLAPTATWGLVQVEPLTLGGSLLCGPPPNGCGLHGFVRDGVWVEA